jgi:hypothetical protein
VSVNYTFVSILRGKCAHEIRPASLRAVFEGYQRGKNAPAGTGIRYRPTVSSSQLTFCVRPPVLYCAHYSFGTAVYAATGIFAMVMNVMGHTGVGFRSRSNRSEESTLQTTSQRNQGAVRMVAGD